MDFLQVFSSLALNAEIGFSLLLPEISILSFNFSDVPNLQRLTTLWLSGSSMFAIYKVIWNSELPWDDFISPFMSQLYGHWKLPF